MASTSFANDEKLVSSDTKTGTNLSEAFELSVHLVIRLQAVETNQFCSRTVFLCKNLPCSVRGIKCLIELAQL